VDGIVALLAADARDKVNARRLELLVADPATALHGGGVLVIDDGTKTAHVGLAVAEPIRQDRQTGCHRRRGMDR
jgi:predicted phosphoribosyltransferase